MFACAVTCAQFDPLRYTVQEEVSESARNVPARRQSDRNASSNSITEMAWTEVGMPRQPKQAVVPLTVTTVQRDREKNTLDTLIRIPFVENGGTLRGQKI